MHTVWHIPELLIHILLKLDGDELDRCYHVSHHWRETLKNNLPPHRRALPDVHGTGSSSRKTLARNLLPQGLRELAAATKAQEEQWCNLANLMPLGDDHFYWREGAYLNLLERLKPHLHPWISTHASEFMEGLASLAGGGMSICVHTRCTTKECIELCDAEHDQDWRNGFLTQPPTSGVRLYCPMGAEWDLSNKSVVHRGGFTWRCASIRVEREKGVRMGDVIDELRGVLVPDHEGGVTGMVLLEWRFREDFTTS